MGQLARGLGWRLRAARRLFGRDASGRLAELLAPPPVEPRAEGRLDEPRQGAVFERGVLTVTGWAIFPTGPTARVEVWLGEELLGLAQLGIPRPDLRALSDQAEAGLAGFSMTRDLSAWPGPDGEVSVRAVATSLGGERLELQPATIAIAPAAAPAPIPAPPPPARPRSKGRRLLVCTHQLCLGGASRYLLELLGELLRTESIDPVVLSAIGGPLQPELEALGIPVHVSGPAPIDDFGAFEGRVEEVLAWAAPRDFEVALVNTASPLTLCGAEVAGRLGIPAVWSIHESFEPKVLWADCDGSVRRLGEEALGRAALGIFEANATRQIYEPHMRRCLTLHYGLDLVPIDAVRRGFDRAAARRGLGIPPEAEVVLCVGTIDPRKAQVALAQAFDLLADRHPRARLALLGAGDTLDSAALAEWAASSRSADRIELVPTTPEIQRWYGVSDLLVCASRIESLPRAVLEGMAWELPVLATAIFGLPELIEDGSTGWLCEPGDTRALAEALDRALSTDRAERRRIGRDARALVERRHALDAHGRDVARLLEQVGVDAAARSG